MQSEFWHLKNGYSFWLTTYHDSFFIVNLLLMPFFVKLNDFICPIDRYMEKMNGLLASVSKGLGFLVVHLAKIQCIHIVSPRSLEELTFQYSR